MDLGGVAAVVERPLQPPAKRLPPREHPVNVHERPSVANGDVDPKPQSNRSNSHPTMGCLQMKALCSRSADGLESKLKFNGATEFNTDFDLSLYETPLRPYDAQTGRFTGVDIMASAYGSLTPYHFGGNNPVSVNDPTGAYMKFNNNNDDTPDQVGTVMGNRSYGQWRHEARSKGLEGTAIGDYCSSQLTGIEVMFDGGSGGGGGGGCGGGIASENNFEWFSVNDKDGKTLGLLFIVDYSPINPGEGDQESRPSEDLYTGGVNIKLGFISFDEKLNNTENLNWSQEVITNRVTEPGQKPNVAFCDQSFNAEKKGIPYMCTQEYIVGKMNSYKTDYPTGYGAYTTFFMDDPQKYQKRFGEYDNVTWNATLSLINTITNTILIQFTYGFTISNGKTKILPLKHN